MDTNHRRASTLTPTLLKPTEAAETLGICTRTLWSLTAPRGTLSCVRVGKAVRYAPIDIEEFIDQQRLDGGNA